MKTMLSRSIQFGIIAMFMGLLLFFLLPNRSLAMAQSATFVSSIPSPNQVLTNAPTSVSITFGQNLKPAGSDIIVYDQNGQIASNGPATVDKNNLKKMDVRMKGGNNQVYVVLWHTVSDGDSQPAIGAFSFGVNTKSSAISVTPNASTNTSSPLLFVLVGVLALALGGAGGFIVGRRQGN